MLGSSVPACPDLAILPKLTMAGELNYDRQIRAFHVY
jgi:hypothetical protein